MNLMLSNHHVKRLSLVLTLEVRGSLVKSDVLIDYEDVLPINATFEMADDDISLVSRILNLKT